MEYGPIIDAIVDAERHFAVDTWTIDELHVWPLIRIRLYPLLAEAFGDTAGVEKQIGGSQSKSRSVFAASLAALRRIATAPAVASGARRVTKRLYEPSDVLFYSLSHMRAKVEGEWRDRHCDPLIDILREQRSLKSVLLESAYDIPHRVPRANDEIALDADAWVRYSSRGGRGGGGRRNVQMQSYDAFRLWLRKEFPRIDSSQLTIGALRRQVSSISSLRDEFEVILGKSGIRACFLACYYHDPGMALAWACKRTGIASVDLQHGMQANPAYSRWTKIPSGGYELLPQVFWNWTASESHGIRSWADKTEGAHRSIVGGFPWLDSFTESEPASINDAQNLRVLFSMPTFEYSLPAWVLTAITRSPARWSWSFRMHPRQQKAREELRTILERTETRATWELDAASDLPLPTVLRNIDVHVTHSSSVILEAEYFGIRTVAIQNDAARSFANQTSTGALVIATDPDSLIEAIKSQAAVRQRTSANRGSGRVQTMMALDALLRRASA